MTKMKNLGWKQCRCEPSSYCHCEPFSTVITSSSLPSLRAHEVGVAISAGRDCAACPRIASSLSLLAMTERGFCEPNAWQSRGETKPIPVENTVYGIIVYKLQDC